MLITYVLGARNWIKSQHYRLPFPLVSRRFQESKFIKLLFKSSHLSVNLLAWSDFRLSLIAMDEILVSSTVLSCLTVLSMAWPDLLLKRLLLKPWPTIVGHVETNQSQSHFHTNFLFQRPLRLAAETDTYGCCDNNHGNFKIEINTDFSAYFPGQPVVINGFAINERLVSNNASNITAPSFY